MKVSAVVVNYYTRHLLYGLLKSMSSDNVLQEIIIVDNSCQFPDQLEEFQDSRLHLITNQTNIGFAAAVNQAVHACRSRWLLLVNPDMQLLPGCITNLLDAAHITRAPLLGPRFYWDEDKIFRLPPATGQSWWLARGRDCGARHGLDAQLFSFYWNIRHDRFWQMQTPFYEPFLSGACLLLDLEQILSQEQTVFDERFFLYFEDTDLCARMLKKGLRPLCVPSAEAVHFWNQSPGQDKAKRMQEAGLAYWDKYYHTRPAEEAIPPEQAVYCQDLGQISAGHVFEAPARSGQPALLFEFGVDPLFVPFAQADMSRPEFTFPRAVWERLAPGDYYARIRSPLSGVQVCWKWKKG